VLGESPAGQSSAPAVEFVRLSVVIPTFNRAEHLREQLAALADCAWWPRRAGQVAHTP
jgi:hypothetical protein